MIVNKSMFPLQTGFGVISKMQDRFATLQMQLGTGEKASKLSEMGRDLPMSLSVRSRLDKIEGFSGNIDTVNLRLSFLDKTMSRFDKIEGEARNSAIQGQYGTNDINMATLPGLSKGRLDELVTLLNSDIAGRYLFGGSNTDTPPLPTTDVLLDGQAGKVGFKSVVTERKAADLGALGTGRLGTAIDPLEPGKVSLREDGVHPFGLKVSTVSTTSSNGGVTVTPQPVPGTAPLGKQVSVSFSDTPAQILPGETITIGLGLPDGTSTQITMKAVTAETASGAPGEFLIGATAAQTATAFDGALQTQRKKVVDGELVAASTFAAASNFFAGPGQPVLRVEGNPATSQGLKVASAADTVIWYQGQSPAVSASNNGRLNIGITNDPAAIPPTSTVTLGHDAPRSPDHGFQIADIKPSTGAITTSRDATSGAVSVQFSAQPAPGDKVEIALTEPPEGATRTVSLTAVSGRAGPGQFSIGADVAATAQSFSKGLELAVSEAAMAAEGNPRQSVTAQVDDATRVNYGMQANESGFLRMVRTMASMSIETYPASDDNSKARFDAMASRQQGQMSEAHNAEAGSIEILTMELGVARSTADNATKRHTQYKAQLDNLLSDVETVSKEDVAMEILALQTRLQASYQTTSMVSKLSLVNFI